MLILSYRKNACGSLTPRQSTTFSTLLVTCTRNHRTLWKCLRCSQIKVLHRLKVSYLPCLINLILNQSPGDVHKRQRRAMAPAFGLVEAKALYPYFTRYSNSVCHRSVPATSSTYKLNVPSPDSSLTNGTRLSRTENQVKVRSSMCVLGLVKQHWMRASRDRRQVTPICSSILKQSWSGSFRL